MKDIVFIKALKIDTVIGVYDWERNIRQTICIDLEFTTDISQAGKSDQLEHTLDYKAISKRVCQYVESSSFQLIEALAEHVAELILKEFPVQHLKLTLSKPGALSSALDVGVIIERNCSG